VVAADIERRRRALEYEQVPARPGQVGHALPAVAPVPMKATRVSASFSIGAPEGSPPV
jgi:hypothetical protein